MNRILVMLLIAAFCSVPVMAQGTFDYASPTQVISTGTGTVTLFVLPVGIKTLNCPSTGIMGIFCDEVVPGDTAGFEGNLPSDLQVVEIDRGNTLASPAWDIPNGCIDAITTVGDFTVFEIDDGGLFNVDIYCGTPGVLGKVCPELQVGDCTQFQGTYFAPDADLAGERLLYTIRAQP